MVPPLIEHAFADQLKPGRKLERIVFEHGPEVVLRNEPRVTDFVGVNVEVHVSLDEENVVDCGYVSNDIRETILSAYSHVLPTSRRSATCNVSVSGT
jgi:hypothetical protein